MSKRTNYQRGREQEYRARDALAAAGAYVVRAAGSKGATDLVAVWSADRPWFVQVKSDGRLPKKEREALLAYAERFKALPVLAKRGKDNKIEFEEVCDDNTSGTTLLALSGASAPETGLGD